MNYHQLTPDERYALAGCRLEGVGPSAIAVRLERLGDRSFTLGFDVVGGETLRARGKIVICCMDPATERSCAVPAALLEVLKQHV